MKDYYFYLGLSHLAYGEDADALNSEALRDDAVKYLNLSKEVIDVAGIVSDGREDYFIGLAYSLNEKTADAVKAFENVRPEQTDFYKKASSLKSVLEK